MDQETYQKRMLAMARLRTLMMGVCAVLLLIIGIFALQVGGQLKVILNNAETTFQTLNTVTTELQQANVPGLLKNMGDLVEEAQDAVEGAMGGVDSAVKKIDSMDIDTLNKAIADLAAVVEPMAKLFGGGKR